MKITKNIIASTLLALLIGAQMLVVPVTMAQSEADLLLQQIQATKTKGPASQSSSTGDALNKNFGEPSTTPTGKFGDGSTLGKKAPLTLKTLTPLTEQEKKDLLGVQTQPYVDKYISDMIMNEKIVEQGGDCVSDQDKQSYIYSILETPLAISSDIAKSAIVDGHEQIDNGDGTISRRCFRWTEIVTLTQDGSIPESVTRQLLISGVPQDGALECPAMADGGSYGYQRDGNYFDCQEVTVVMSPLSQGGIGFLNAYVSLIYKWVAGIIGIISVLIMVISGLQIITAQGEPSAVEEAKKRIFQSIGGILLLFFASALLYMINPTFFNPPTGGSTTTNSTPAP